MMLASADSKAIEGTLATAVGWAWACVLYRHGMRFIVAVLLVFGAGGAACGSPQADTRDIAGVVVDIRSGGGFGEVESFTVKDGTEEFEIFVDPDATYDFSLAHLNSHRAGAEPVRVEAVLQDGKLVATEIGDA